jgi:hypothetical protein
VIVMETQSPYSPISSIRRLAWNPSSWMHSNNSFAVNGLLMVCLLVVADDFEFEPRTISGEVTRFATCSRLAQFQ